MKSVPFSTPLHYVSITNIILMKYTILLTIFGLNLALLSAQTAKIQGHLYNDKNEIMPYATVMLLENSTIINGTYTDEKGEYTFPSLKAGTYSIKATNLDYQNEIKKDISLSETESKIIDISLKPNALNLSIASKPLESEESFRTVALDSAITITEATYSAAAHYSVTVTDASGASSLTGDDGGSGEGAADEGESSDEWGSDADGVTDVVDGSPAPSPSPATTTSYDLVSIGDVSATGAKYKSVSKAEKTTRSDSKESPKALKTAKAGSTRGATFENIFERGVDSDDDLYIESKSKKEITKGEKKGRKEIKEDKKPTEILEVQKETEPLAGRLTAGEVNDFSKWKMWKSITGDEFKDFQNEWKMIPKDRYVVQVENMQYHPLPNLKVELRSKDEIIWTGRTDNTGKAELWADFFQQIPQAKGTPEIIRVYYEGKFQDLTQINPFSQGINYMKLEKNCDKNLQADIAFVVDATGSMGDEISHIRADLSMIAGKLKDTLKGWEVNFASVFYTDQGESYLTKSAPFSPKVAETQSFMQNTPSGGGGDFPEAVESGLEEAIQRLQWNDNASTRIIFLVLDAPSHNDIETLIKLQMQIRAAAHKGIRIIPVACSGIDKSTEYLLRSIALATNGTYAFLTDDSGIGSAHTKPTTDNYKVEKFYQLAVRLVSQYTYQPDCKPLENKTVAQTEKVYKSTVIEKNETKAEKDKDEILGKIEETNKVWVLQKTVSWKYFPNPTQGTLSIEVEDNIGEIFLSDVSGKVLERYEVKSEKAFQIDLTAYANGIYFLRYEYEPDKWLNGKVILER